MQPMLSSKHKYTFLVHARLADLLKKYATNDNVVICALPASSLFLKMKKTDLLQIAKIHHVTANVRDSSEHIRKLFIDHSCSECASYALAFILKTKQVRTKLPTFAPGKMYVKMPSFKKRQTHLQALEDASDVPFPPSPPTSSLIETIISGWCNAMSETNVTEEGCAVCGRLTLRSELLPFNENPFDLSLLDPFVLGLEDITRLERKSVNDPVQQIKGPVFDSSSKGTCKLCHKELSNGVLPAHALANGLWIGDVPPELQNLSYAEKLLVARVRHNRCIVRVSSGMHKMRANAILFANPMPKIYHVLPPPKEEISEVLAFIFTGPCQPTKDDFRRIPLLVRRNKVAKALEWLKLNHIDYEDLTISYKNLDEYPEDMPPIAVDFHETDGSTNKNPEATAVNDNDVEDGVEAGDCPFTVHGLNGEELSSMSLKALTAVALQHLTNNGKTLAIGHAPEPESIYQNPQLYPQMFPWLFPYGLGGIENKRGKKKVAERKWKQHLLMYHDKRFQTDQYFPLIAFNHEQIKQSAGAGVLLADRKSFNIVSERLLNINLNVLEDLSKRMVAGEHVKPQTQEEKDCYQLINDLDHIAHNVQGSMTSKKHMRNEIWSTVAYKGAPSWFITFAPADLKHPLCLYYADKNLVFKPEVRTPDECYGLIANNPIAGARFFHFTVLLFIKHVLGVDAGHDGLYGKTSAYYGTVEQQGRLTLHLHSLLWVKNALTPQEIRDKLMDNDSKFNTELIRYLESAHKGE